MSEDSKREVYIIIKDDRLWKSIVADFFTIGMAGALIGVGVLTGSSAMQWVAAFVWFMFLLARAKSIKDYNRYTLNEAKVKIDTMLASRKSQEV